MGSDDVFPRAVAVPVNIDLANGAGAVGLVDFCDLCEFPAVHIFGSPVFGGI